MTSRRDVRPVIGAYHLAPVTVRQQLETMFANGQRRLALVLWFADLSPFAAIATDERYGHVVNSRLGRLLPVHEANLRSVLRLIRDNAYLEVIFRFATQDGSRPAPGRRPCRPPPSLPSSPGSRRA